MTRRDARSRGPVGASGRARAPDPLVALARTVLRRVLAVAVVLGVVAALVGDAAAGPTGAASAALGTALGAVLVAGGVPGLRSPRGRSALTPVAASLALRLVLYAAAIALVSRAAWIHGPSLALATAASVSVLVAVGMHAVASGPRPGLELDDTTVTDGS